MALSNFMNLQYDKAVSECRESIKMGRADNEVAVGDVVEMLLSISLASKDAMLDWEWLGIVLVEMAAPGTRLGDLLHCASCLR